MLIQAHWFRDGIEIKKGKKYDIIAKGAQRILVVNKCLLDDEAEYACEAKAARTSGMLTVIGKTESPFFRFVLFYANCSCHEIKL